MMNAEAAQKLFRSKRETQEHCTQTREREGENECLEGEGRVKTKLMSMWTNMKYGWTTKLKTNFSKDSPVWLLGRCYHRKMIIDPNDIGSNVGVEGEGIEGFKRDFISRIWLTYRKEFPILNGSNFTTDCGWGCMLRSGQMILAQGLVCHFLGRDWRWYESSSAATLATLPDSDWVNKTEKIHRKIIKWFGDIPTGLSPFSIHMLVMLGEASGKRAGDWYGPGSVSYLIKQAVELASKENRELEQLCVYVAQDCAVYVQDVVDLCCDPQLRTTKAIILLIPLRLGAEKFNAVYAPSLTYFLTMENCIGIIGGRPRHSLYFVGFQDDKLIHLDPHYCQEMVNVWDAPFSLYSFHCRSPRKLNLMKLDPSCCIGFYFSSLDEFDKFRLTMEHSPHSQADYPMFVFCDGRSQDAIRVTQLSIPDDSLRSSDFHDTDDELESEEFEIL